MAPTLHKKAPLAAEVNQRSFSPGLRCKSNSKDGRVFRHQCTHMGEALMNSKYSSYFVPACCRRRTSQFTLASAAVVGLSLLTGANLAFAHDTLHLVERELNNTTIHHGAKGNPDSIGDMIVFANPIFDSTNTHQLGTVQGNCVRVVVGKSWECFFTLVLANDRITLEGPYADEGESVFAITGGTGRYAGARGQMSLRARESKLLAPGAPPTTDMTYEIL